VAAAEGPTYRGTYNLSEITTGRDPADAGGWRSDGSFVLTASGININDATLAVGSQERPTSVGGSLTLPFGPRAQFTAMLQTRQLDLDRALGGGPNDPASIPRAQAQLVQAVKNLPILPMPGRIILTVPAVVIGGALVQEVNFAASVSADGWAIDAVHARFPGQATLDATGKVATAGGFDLQGTAHLAVAQPAAFATWLRGRGQGPGRPLPAFELSGNVTVDESGIAVEKASAKIGAAAISGTFRWQQSTDGKRTL